jgi:putative hydrolase of the HAD superfamily
LIEQIALLNFQEGLVALKALFFDFGGTLDLYPVVYEDCINASSKMLEVLAKSGIDLRDKFSSEDFYKHIKTKNDDYRKWKYETLIELSEMDVWKNYILYEEPKKELLDDAIVRELTYLIEAGFHTRYVRPEAKEALEKLKGYGLKVGIISNVLSITQVSRDLKRYGLDKYFNPVITSAEFGRVKPHPAIFTHAAECAGVKPDECLYIGNSPLKDVKGARNGGFMGVVQIIYEFNSSSDVCSDAEPDYLIKNLLELPEIVSDLLRVKFGQR